MSFLAGVKKAAGDMAASAKKAYADMQKPPVEVQCTGCPLKIPVPAELWDTKPTDPSVTCATCNAVVKVPSTRGKQSVQEAATSTKAFVANAATNAKNEYNRLKSAPTEFHCAHCNALLAVPTGPWLCQTCTAENAEAEQKCKQCTQAKSQQKAICGVCRQSTAIPTTNFSDSVKSSFVSISQSGKKVYYDVAGKPYVTCKTCGEHIAVTTPAGLEKQPIEHHHAGAAAAPAPAPAAAPGMIAPPQEHAEGQSAPAPGGIAPHVDSATLSCPKCKNLVTA